MTPLLLWIVRLSSNLVCPLLLIPLEYMANTVLNFRVIGLEKHLLIRKLFIDMEQEVSLVQLQNKLFIALEKSIRAGKRLKDCSSWVAETFFFWSLIISLHKRRSFPLRNSLVNVTKSAVSSGFTEEVLNRKVHFVCSVPSKSLPNLKLNRIGKKVCIPVSLF